MNKPLKVVFDTNIYLSAILFGGNPRQCLELARGGEVELCVSDEILLEISEKLRGKFLWERVDIRDVVEGILAFSRAVKPRIKITVIDEDEPDNRILECAVEAGADYIISGDKKHMLSLKRFEGVSVVSAKEFLDIYYHKN